MTDIPEPLFPNCTVPQSCDVCGLWLGYSVSEKQAKILLRAHKRQKKCNEILEGEVEF